MNRHMTLSLIAAVGLSTPLLADATQDINRLEDRIFELEKKLDQQKVEKVSDREAQESFTYELEDRIDEVETATLVNKINFGFDFRTRLDNFSTTTAAGRDDDQSNVWSNRFRLNMDSQITRYMKFTGRLTMYKNWADLGNYPLSDLDSTQGRRPSDSTLYVERAYIDWKVYDGEVPTTLTIGRQPSSDGPSYQFKEDTARKATYSAIAFDGATDGIFATFDLQKVSGVDDMVLRLAYGKGFQENTGVNYVGDPNGIDDTDLYGIFFDTGLGIDGSLLQIGAVRGADLVTNTTNSSTAVNANIGDVDLVTVMAEFTDLYDTDIDVFAHVAMSKSNPSGETGIDQNGDPVGLLSNELGDTERKTGYAYWLGARYTLPVPSMKDPKIGLEFNHGTKYWYSFTQGSNDITNKLATRGNSTELYYIQPINRYAHLRLGAQFIDYDHTGSGYYTGKPLPMSDPDAANAIEKLQNYYLLFNVSY